ncbi:hypothetical protein GGF50DRAFT_58035 [Schizophyllum commune]
MRLLQGEGDPLLDTSIDPPASLPTPESSPGPSDYPTIVVSTAFNVHTITSPTFYPDLELLTTDNVLFSVSRKALANVSCNNFDCVLAIPDARQVVPDRAEVLNLVLHAAYGLSPIAYKPSVDLIVEAILRMPAYGMDANTLAAPGTPFYEGLRPCIALAPMRAYIVAASHDLYSIAQMASAHLLSYPMQTLADADASAMGAVYLKRLLVLQHTRPSWLREVLARPPDIHPKTPGCSIEAQRALAQAWSRCAALIIAERRPDTSSSTLRATFAALKNDTACHDCQQVLETRISKAVSDWIMCPVSDARLLHLILGADGSLAGDNLNASIPRTIALLGSATVEIPRIYCIL